MAGLCDIWRNICKMKDEGWAHDVKCMMLFVVSMCNDCTPFRVFFFKLIPEKVSLFSFSHL